MKRSSNYWPRYREGPPESDGRDLREKRDERDGLKAEGRSVRNFEPRPSAFGNWTAHVLLVPLTIHERRTKRTAFLSILLDDRHRLDDRRLPVPMLPRSSILFRINDMEARRMTGRQQLRIGTDNGQPQGLEFQSQRQMQDLW